MASVLERVMIGCFFELQETAPTLTKYANPEIEWRCICEAQSAFEYPAKAECEPPRTSLKEIFSASQIMEDLSNSVKMGSVRCIEVLEKC